MTTDSYVVTDDDGIMLAVLGVNDIEGETVLVEIVMGGEASAVELTRDKARAFGARLVAWANGEESDEAIDARQGDFLTWGSRATVGDDE